MTRRCSKMTAREKWRSRGSSPTSHFIGDCGATHNEYFCFYRITIARRISLRSTRHAPVQYLRSRRSHDLREHVSIRDGWRRGSGQGRGGDAQSSERAAGRLDLTIEASRPEVRVGGAAREGRIRL